MTTEKEFMTDFIVRHSKPNPNKRIDWKAKFKAERNAVINEAIVKLKDEMRDKPADWRRGYNSAITTLELMKSEIQ